VCLSNAVANVAHGEYTRFATRFEYPVADFFDQRTEVECARVTHSVGTVDQHLRLGQVLFGPVHAQAQCVTLEIGSAQTLAAQLAAIYWHASPGECTPRFQLGW